MRAIDLTGKVYGKWTVLSRAPYYRGMYSQWNCRCECGTEAVVLANNMRKGTSVCCLACRAKKQVRHGEIVGGKPSVEYKTLEDLKNRCLNPEWIERFGVSRSAINWRLQAGWAAELAVSTPSQHRETKHGSKGQVRNDTNGIGGIAD